MPKIGRPSKYSDDIVQQICDRLSEGEPLAAICRDPEMPAVSTIWQWEKDRPDVSEAIARARLVGFDAIALEALAIADATGNDTTVNERGNETPNSEWISRSRLRVETRLKLLAKWDPKRYGDKTLVGSDPDNPLPTGFVVNLKKAEG